MADFYKTEEVLGKFCLIIFFLVSIPVLIIVLLAKLWLAALLVAPCVVFCTLGVYEMLFVRNSEKRIVSKAIREARQSESVPTPKNKEVAMRQVVSNKIYDTSTAERIGSYEEVSKQNYDPEPQRSCLGGTYVPENWLWCRRDTTTTLYRSKKGQYFVIRVERVRYYANKKGDVTNDTTYQGEIKLISREAALTLCAEHGLITARDCIMKEFEEG